MNTHPSIAELRVWGLLVLTIVRNLSKLGKHLLLGDANVVESRETVIRRGKPRPRFRSCE